MLEPVCLGDVGMFITSASIPACLCTDMREDVRLHYNGDSGTQQLNICTREPVSAFRIKNSVLLSAYSHHANPGLSS